MSQVLGRGEHQPWATKWPVSSVGAMLIAAVVGIGITYSNIEMWDSVAAVVLGPISQHEILSHRARRLQVAAFLKTQTKPDPSGVPHQSGTLFNRNLTIQEPAKLY
jgi:hypothetical protein